MNVFERLRTKQKDEEQSETAKYFRLLTEMDIEKPTDKQTAELERFMRELPQEFRQSGDEQGKPTGRRPRTIETVTAEYAEVQQALKLAAKASEHDAHIQEASRLRELFGPLKEKNEKIRAEKLAEWMTVLQQKNEASREASNADDARKQLEKMGQSHPQMVAVVQSKAKKLAATNQKNEPT